MKHVACCSFGKDSIATILLAKEHNEPLDEVIYVEVMFDEETSADNPEQIKWIYEYAKPRIEQLGYPVRVLRAKENYTTLFERVKTRSKHADRNGKIQGFPLGMGCFLNGMCKIKPIKDYLKGNECIEYVGIAIDEPKRLARITGNKVSLLAKYRYTEKMAMELCRKYDLVSPIYKKSSRGGCWFCPNASKKELCETYRNNRQLFDKLTNLYQRNKYRMIRTKFCWNKEYESVLKQLEQSTAQGELL